MRAPLSLSGRMCAPLPLTFLPSKHVPQDRRVQLGVPSFQILDITAGDAQLSGYQDVVPGGLQVVGYVGGGAGEGGGAQLSGVQDVVPGGLQVAGCV